MTFKKPEGGTKNQLYAYHGRGRSCNIERITNIKMRKTVRKLTWQKWSEQGQERSSWRYGNLGKRILEAESMILVSL